MTCPWIFGSYGLYSAGISNTQKREIVKGVRLPEKFSKDSTLKPHGFRNTLQAKFDAADTPNKTSGYLIGWKNQDTVGMQKEYNKQGYPHLQLLQVLKACHAVEEWAS